MHFRTERIPRLTGMALLAIASVTATGCWEEIHYQPGKTAEGPQRTEPTQGRTEIERENPAVQADAPRQTGNDGPHATSQSANDTTESSSESLPPAKHAEGKAPAAGHEPVRTARAAWQLGSQWSMGAALFAKGLPAERYQPALDAAASAARTLRIELAALPDTKTGKDPIPAVMAYLLDEQGPRLAEKLKTQYDARHAALLELAIRSHMLLLVYSPHNLARNKGPLNEAHLQDWVDRLAQLASRCRLPETVWSPLLENLRRQAPYTEVKRDVFKLHRQVAEELASAG